jgi:hypothetical protein
MNWIYCSGAWKPEKYSSDKSQIDQSIIPNINIPLGFYKNSMEKKLSIGGQAVIEGVMMALPELLCDNSPLRKRRNKKPDCRNKR